MNAEIELILEKINTKRIWDEEPVFCFTSDIDWASEDVMEEYFLQIDKFGIEPTLFVTHDSPIIDHYFQQKKIERGIHPNFLNGSSHGSTFEEIVQTCIKFAPETKAFRSHRLFDVTDITHLLKEKYGFRYVSNLGTIMQPMIRPILHESGLIHFPIFFEDGTHLWNRLDIDIKKYEHLFISPGIKIISFHPMNFVFNSHSITYMRGIKDSMSREAFNNITRDYIVKFRNTASAGIADIIGDIVNYAVKKNVKVMKLSALYNETVR